MCSQVANGSQKYKRRQRVTFASSARHFCVSGASFLLYDRRVLLCVHFYVCRSELAKEASNKAARFPVLIKRRVLYIKDKTENVYI